MRQIDRLLQEARQLSGAAGRQLVLALVERRGDAWITAAQLWDRLPEHSPTLEDTAHATQEAALEHLRAFPGGREAAVILDDLE